MPIKRYLAEKDTTITNAYKLDLASRATDANMGASDSLEMFSIFAQANTSSIEKSRILIQFPTSEIISDRAVSKIPNSGSVKFFLRLYNVKHPFSLPKDYKATILPVSQSWDEGYGLDMESYTDFGWSNNGGGSGATWVFSQSGTLWAEQGGSYITSSQYVYDAEFKDGTEDIEVDVTNIVEDWINGTVQNNGFIIKLSSSYENSDYFRSFYTKKFSARGTQFFYSRPNIEARWESATLDDRNNFFASSSALNAEDNKMNIYFYNKVNGRLKNIVGDVLPGVKFYTNSNLTNEITASFLNIANPSQGIYRAKVSLNTTSSVIYDKWYNTSSLAQYFSSSFDVLQRQNYDFNDDQEYIFNISNLKNSYNQSEFARFKIFIREKDWQPTIYTVAYNTVENSQINDLYYKFFRLNDNYTVLDYSTGSIAYTKTSYDSNGNYFDIDMNIFEKNYVYGVKFARYNGVDLKEYPTTFKFKVE